MKRSDLTPEESGQIDQLLVAVRMAMHVATEVADELPNPYIETAFRTVLEHLLKWREFSKLERTP